MAGLFITPPTKFLKRRKNHNKKERHSAESRAGFHFIFIRLFMEYFGEVCKLKKYLMRTSMHKERNVA